MNIALLAHDNKKELLEAFCIAYKWILDKHTLFSNGATGEMLKDSVTLDINNFNHGELGEQQIIARAAYNEMDLVIFFKDFDISDNSVNQNINALRNACDTNNIPFATNLATAEVLVNGLERGDMAFRDIIHSTKN